MCGAGFLEDGSDEVSGLGSGCARRVVKFFMGLIAAAYPAIYREITGDSMPSEIDLTMFVFSMCVYFICAAVASS